MNRMPFKKIWRKYGIQILKLLHRLFPMLRHYISVCPAGMCNLSTVVERYEGTLIDLGSEKLFSCHPGIALNDQLHVSFSSPGIVDYVAIFKHGKVYSECGFIIIGDSNAEYLVEELSVARRQDTSWNNHRFMDVFKHQVFHPVIKRTGSVAVITTTAATTNYYHFLLEALPRLELLSRTGITPDWYYIPSKLKYQREVLQAMKIPLSKTIQPSDKVVLQAENLIVPAPRFYCVTDWGINNFSKYGLDFIATTFTSELTANGQKRIYIRRGNAKTRRVINENDAIETLTQKFGFSCITPDQLSVKEQATIFYQAELVVGMHGAGLSNIIFCRPATAVIELFAENSIAHYYNVLAAKRKLKYYYARFPAINKTDLVMNNDLLTEIISKVLSDTNNDLS